MINSYYTQVLPQVKQAFQSDKTIELRQFLDKENYQKIKKIVQKITPKKNQEIMSHSFLSSKINMPTEIDEFVKSVIGKIPKQWEVHAFSWKDYSIVNDEKLEPAGFDIIFDITENWNPNFGGCIFYIDGSGDYTKLLPEENKLILVQRDAKKHRFVQYLNHFSKNKKRIFLIARI